MNREKNVKLSTLKSNGIFLFSSGWLNLWDVDVCLYATRALRGVHAFSPEPTNCTCVHVFKCLCAAIITHTRVIQNKNYALSSGCSVIFPLIKRSAHSPQLLASAHEVEKSYMWVFYTIFSLSSRRHSPYLRWFFSILQSFLQPPKCTLPILPALLTSLLQVKHISLLTARSQSCHQNGDAGKL